MGRKIITIGEQGNEAKRKDFSVDTSEGKWEGQEMETPASAPLIDNATGRESVVRKYEIALPPESSMKGIATPSDEEMLNYYKGQVLAMLWKDGWEQIGEMKFIRDTKKNRFYIFIPASARKSEFVLEKAKTLNQVIHGNRNKN